MTDFHLIFCDPKNPEDRVEIPFKLTGSNASQKWLLHLYKAMAIQGKIPLNHRWCGWEGNIEAISDRINEWIDVARKYHPEIFNELRASDNPTQDELNYLHTWFEIYRGELENPHPLFRNGTQEYQDAIENLNLEIHAYERAVRKYKTANFNFQYDHEFSLLLPEDKAEFEMMRYPNSLYLEYNMRGKSLFVYFMDDDDHVGPDNIRTYKYLNADFALRINGWSEQELKEHREKEEFMWHRKENFLNSLGYYRGDPNNTFGFLRLAYSEWDDIESLIEPRQFLCGAKFG